MAQIAEEFAKEKYLKGDKMKEDDKIRIELAKITGEFIGTLKAIVWEWDTPKELKEKWEAKIIELENKKNES